MAARLRFAELLKLHRQTAGFTKADLARRIGVTPPYIGDLERGREKAPPIARCRKIADALELSDKQRSIFLACAAYERTPDEIKACFEEFRRSGNEYALRMLTGEDAG